MGRNSLSNVASGGLLFGIGSIAANIAQFLFGILIIRYMPVDHFGAVSLINTLIMMAVTISVLGMQNGLPRMMSHALSEKNNLEVMRYSGAAFLLVLLSSAFFSLLMYFSGGLIANLFNMPLILEINEYFAFLIVPLSIMIVFNALFRGLNNARAKVLYQDFLLNILKLGFLIVAYVFVDYTLSTVVAIYLGSALATLLVYARYTKKEYFETYGVAFRSDETCSLIRFSLPLLGVALSVNVVNWSGVISLGYLAEASDIAHFTAVQRAAQIMTIPLLATGFLFLPVATKLITDRKTSELKGLYVGVTKWIVLVVVPLLVYLFYDADYFLLSLFGDGYKDLGLALKVLILASFIHVCMGPNSMTLVAHGNTKVVFKASIVASMISVIGCFLLVPGLGVLGAAISIGLGQVISNLYTSWNMYGLYSIHLKDSNFMKPIAFSIITNGLILYFVGYLKPEFPQVFMAFFPIMLIVSLMAPHITKAITKEDQELIVEIKQKFIKP